MRKLVLATLPVALAAMTMATSEAAPKKPKPKPIEKSYTASATPDPTINLPSQGACKPLTPTGMHKEPFKVPAAGRMVIEMTGFEGDWDLCVADAAGEIMASSAGFIEATTETVAIKFKKGQEISILASNGGGTPTAQVKYVFTYA